MSHAMTASPEPSFKAPWRVGDAMVGVGMLDEQHQRVDISAHARTARRGLPQTKKKKKDWKRVSAESSLMLHPPTPSLTDNIGQGTELFQSSHYLLTRPQPTNGNRKPVASERVGRVTHP